MPKNQIKKKKLHAKIKKLNEKTRRRHTPKPNSNIVPNVDNENLAERRTTPH